MMTWDYRVFREEDGDYVIREVFYGEDGSIIGCTANVVEPFGSTLEELAQSIEDFKAALALPVLTLKDIPELSPTFEKQKNGKTISHEQLRIQLGLNETQEWRASRHHEKFSPSLDSADETKRVVLPETSRPLISLKGLSLQ